MQLTEVDEGVYGHGAPLGLASARADTRDYLVYLREAVFSGDGVE